MFLSIHKRHFSRRCTLVNSLGCNEAGVIRQYFVDHDTDIDGPTVPAGFGVADKQLVLIPDEARTMADQVGEIAIRSSFLSHGYFGRPDLTDAAFAADPSGGDRRLYLTGDIGEILPDGCLVYHGRTDTRIKIRGQSVELSEVEIQLQQHERVAEAAVKPLEDGRNRIRLAAFVVPSATPGPDFRELREFLAHRLPGFMVPSKFVILNSLPRLPNGKVDRQALAMPAEIARTNQPDIDRRHGPAYVAPIETIEHQLVHIWEELLGVRPIGVRDNFFDLGGDSLLAVQMMEDVESRCGEAVAVSALLGGATIAELARALVMRRLHEADSLLVRVQRGSPGWPCFFLHGDFRGGGFYCLNLARALGNHQRFYALTAHGLSGEPVPPTIEAMAASYVEMVRRVEPEGPYLLGGLCHAGLIAFEMARQLEHKGQKVGLVAMIGPPAWNPPHWRFIRDTAAAVVSLCGVDPHRATTLFLAMRERRIRLRRFWQRSVNWRKAAASRPLADLLVRLLRVAKRGISAARSRILAAACGNGGSWAPSDAVATGDGLMACYQQAVAAYVRRPYSGRVAIFWPSEVLVNTLGGPEVPWNAAPDPTLGWGKIASDVEVRLVPGDYTTSITTHVGVLADRVREAIHRARVAHSRSYRLDTKRHQPRGRAAPRGGIQRH